MRDPSRSQTMRRLMVYLTGIAIGLMLLGVFNARRTREAQVRRAQEEALRAAQPGPASPVEPGATDAPASNPS